MNRLAGVLLLGVLVAGCASGDPTAAEPAATDGAASASPSATPVPRSTSSGGAGRWVPAPATAWQWQLVGPLDLTVDVPVYDVDGGTTTAAQVDELHRLGRRVICYLNAGAYENFRPDKEKFPAEVLGKALDGWPDERWLDIRRLDTLRPIISARIAECRAKGFDAVEPDNVDGYANESGFPLTAAEQLAYNRWIAAEVHRQGMSVALKNDLDQIAELEPSFDFAVNEECAEHDECDSLLPFTRAGKAVLHVEYSLGTGEFCDKTRALGFSSMRKPVDLGPAREPC